MKNKILKMEILALVLVFGFMVIGCIIDEGSTSTPTKEFKKEYNTPTTNATLDFDKGFPATVEVYVLGAGGGGQGGHQHNNTSLTGNMRGTGGCGGGGAAAYMKFEIKESVTFSITVGKGGDGGARRQQGITESWRAGENGDNGGNSQVIASFGSTTINLNAAGGAGGNRGNNQQMIGGAGGIQSQKPVSNLLEWDTKPGMTGSNGSQNNSLVANSNFQGGNAARLNIGSVSPFGGGFGDRGTGVQSGGGGRGGYNVAGNPGGDGHVVIVITYPE